MRVLLAHLLVLLVVEVSGAALRVDHRVGHLVVVVELTGHFLESVVLGKVASHCAFPLSWANLIARFGPNLVTSRFVFTGIERQRFARSVVLLPLVVVVFLGCLPSNII